MKKHCKSRGWLFLVCGYSECRRNPASGFDFVTWVWLVFFKTNSKPTFRFAHIPSALSSGSCSVAWSCIRLYSSCTKRPTYSARALLASLPLGHSADHSPSPARLLPNLNWLHQVNEGVNWAICQHLQCYFWMKWNKLTVLCFEARCHRSFPGPRSTSVQWCHRRDQNKPPGVSQPHFIQRILSALSFAHARCWAFEVSGQQRTLRWDGSYYRQNVSHCFVNAVFWVGFALAHSPKIDIPLLTCRLTPI